MKWLVTSAAGGNPENYLTWLSGAGIESALILSSDPAPGNLFAFDALMLTGGGDVDPARYGAVRAPETQGVDPARDEMECRLIRRFMDGGKAVFGVCRGIQILNVALGGRLIQHVPSVVGSAESHQRSSGKDAVHPIALVDGTELAGAFDPVIYVNSAHHQSVDPGSVGAGLCIAALSGQGIVEAVEGVGLRAPLLGVQWHPERLEPSTHVAAAGLLKRMTELAAG